MDSIKIVGGSQLNGVIPISGAKNATLPLMIASLLSDETLTLGNVPRLRDVAQLNHILSNHGVDYSVDGKRVGQDDLKGQTLHLTARTIVDTMAPYELVSKMRASFWVIGPLVARERRARVSLPGGCAIGTRPVDFFIEGLTKLGASIDIEAGYVVVDAPKGLVGAPYLVEKGLDMDAVKEPTLIFSGTAREAAKGFPANVNVAVALSLAGIGPDRTTIDIWADPTVTRNCHAIEVDSDSAKLSLAIENIPSENPKTGRITALSVIAALRKLNAPVRVGT